MPNKRDLLSVTDFTPEETLRIIKGASKRKNKPVGQPLAGKSVALLFEKPSLRTRVSFQVGIQQLGGYSLYLGREEVGMGSREPISDVAKVLSGYVDCIVARVFHHENLVELARHSTVPVINALSDWEHPCQAMADLLTIYENKGDLNGLTLAYIGDGNNVARSLCLALPGLGMNFNSASPEGYNLDQESVEKARLRSNGSKATATVRTLIDPAEAVADADIVYTDVWASMGQEDEAQTRQQVFEGYTVDPELLSKARPGALFMHDMPAHYGEEVAPGMLDHPQSVAFPQAHNRLHAQKSVLEFLLAGR
jgi:ornithine carbamoyltransferase